MTPSHYEREMLRTWDQYVKDRRKLYRMLFFVLQISLIRRSRFYVFFFQAEDGIRDLTVTGVQTCALPITLYFLDGKLADGILDAYRKDDIIKKFLMNTSTAEIDVEVKKVALEDMQTPPFKARVDFYLVYYSPVDHTEIKRDLYTANFVFVFKSKVPNELIPINPLGVAITYFREDQAFK